MLQKKNSPWKRRVESGGGPDPEKQSEERSCQGLESQRAVGTECQADRATMKGDGVER